MPCDNGWISKHEGQGVKPVSKAAHVTDTVCTTSGVPRHPSMDVCAVSDASVIIHGAALTPEHKSSCRRALHFACVSTWESCACTYVAECIYRRLWKKRNTRESEGRHEVAGGA